jgi:hypothetical protein
MSHLHAGVNDVPASACNRRLHACNPVGSKVKCNTRVVNERVLHAAGC